MDAPSESHIKQQLALKISRLLLHSPLPPMVLLNKDPKALFLAAIVVVAMIMSSCHAIDSSDECYKMLPCTETKCEAYCKSLGYPMTRCYRTFDPSIGKDYDMCCCDQNE
uniref:Uncharacterized protein n=1 Tax=Avena sativa TaxID=4498 RepID=A0ACD5TDT1_AVESA